MDETFGVNFRGVGRQNTKVSGRFRCVDGALGKRVIRCVRLYFSQILAAANLFCNPECIPNCIPIGSAKVSPTVCATASLQPPGECPIATHRSPLGPVEVREPLRAQQNILSHRRGVQGPPGGGGSCWAMPRAIWGLRVINTDNVQPVDRVGYCG